MVWKDKINLNGALRAVSKHFELEDAEDSHPVPFQLVKVLVEEASKTPALRKVAAEMLLHCQTVGDVNYFLDKLYNIADREKIWCGFPSDPYTI